MNTLRVLLIACVLGAGVKYWNHHQAVRALAAATDENGFVEVPPMDGQTPDTVYVVAALNCPHEDAQRADRLAEQLTSKGIPTIRTNQVSVHLGEVGSALAHEYVDRYNSVMNGRLPIAFIGGRAKSDATLDEVVAEFSTARK